MDFIKRAIKSIAYIELLIGLSTISGLITFTLLSLQKKPLNVVIFVLTSSMVSIAIGMGLLKHKEWARVVLVFFSGYIVLTKIMIFFGLLRFNGEMITFLPQGLKNFISITYHYIVITIFTRQSIKKYFIEQ